LGSDLASNTDGHKALRRTNTVAMSIPDVYSITCAGITLDAVGDRSTRDPMVLRVLEALILLRETIQF
jgi:hypothetical protein